MYLNDRDIRLAKCKCQRVIRVIILKAKFRILQSMITKLKAMQTEKYHRTPLKLFTPLTQMENIQLDQAELPTMKVIVGTRKIPHHLSKI